jgi:hypothetical protein
MFPKLKNAKTNRIFRSKRASFWSLKSNFVFALILTSLLPCQAGASASFGQAADLFTQGAGARAMAMGGAFTGVADDASASYYNPAGLAFLDEHQLMIMHAPLFIDSNYNFLSSAHPFGDKYGAVAISDSLLLSNGFQTRDKFNNKIGNDSFDHNAVIASYAHKLNQKISGGVNAKFIQQKVAGFSGNALGLDVGLMYKPMPLLSFGASIANMNSPEITLQSSPDVYRSITRVGVASEVFRNRLLLSVDVLKMQQQDNLYSAGLEFTPNKLFAIRTGYNANHSYTLGVGIMLKTFHIDYAFSDTDVGAFNKVSFTWLWHNIYKTDLEPPVKEGRAVFPLAGFENKVAFRTTVPDQVVAKWSLKITDKDGKEVRSLGGDLRPPENIDWDARNSIGEPIVGGTYNYSFVVDYKNGKSWTKNGNIAMDMPARNKDQDVDMTIELNGAKESELNMTNPENQESNLTNSGESAPATTTPAPETAPASAPGVETTPEQK